MTANKEIWERLKQPPPSALKTIAGGRLRGMTDINPQWRYQTLTEEFGPCGDGWKYTIDELWMTEGNEGEKTAWARISLYVVGICDDSRWSDPIPGIGGSMYIAKETGGLRTNDEAYKMAVTDALGVAFKMLGGAADIYAGLWDGSKYRDISDDKPKDTDSEGNDKPNICPECGKPAIIKGKPEYGGGWLCYKKKDGCGAKWSDEEWNELKDDKKHKFMKEMLKFQAKLDTIVYHKILGEHGFENAHEITEREDMKKVYIAMKEAEPIDIDQQDIPY